MQAFFYAFNFTIYDLQVQANRDVQAVTGRDGVTGSPSISVQVDALTVAQLENARNAFYYA